MHSQQMSARGRWRLQMDEMPLTVDHHDMPSAGKSPDVPSTGGDARPDSAAELLRKGGRQLERVGIAHGHREAEWLLGHLMGIHPLELYLDGRPISSEIIERFSGKIAARVQGMPLQYLIGETEFFGQRINVAPGVFIPRPETEIVLDAFLKGLAHNYGQSSKSLNILDLGTGTGCLAVAIACELPACQVTAVELSWWALCLARKNILQQDLSSRIRLVQGNWLKAIYGTFDGIISNPPYIPTERVQSLPLDVRCEPKLSLDGGEDGMQGLKQLLDQAPQALAAGGVLVLECGEDQVELLKEMAGSLAWVDQATALSDLVGRPRGLLVTRCSSA